MADGRFPPPWSVDELEACFVVRDSNDLQLVYVYFEDEPGRRLAAKLLTKDQARRLQPTSRSCLSYSRAVKDIISISEGSPASRRTWG